MLSALLAAAVLFAPRAPGDSPAGPALVPALPPLQRLVDATPDGGTLVLEPGRYVLDRALRLQGRRDLTIAGVAGTEIVVRSATADVIDAHDCEGLTLRNLVCYHLTEASGCSAPVLLVVGGKDLCVEDCSLNGCGIEGLVAQRVQGARVLGNLIHHNSDLALSLYRIEGLQLAGNLLFDNASIGAIGQCEGARCESNWQEGRPVRLAPEEIDALPAGPPEACAWASVLRGDAETVLALLEDGTAQLDERRAGLGLAHFALLGRHDELAATLIRRGAPIDTRALPHDDTCLHSAARFGLGAASAALLERGAALDATNAEGRTPLHVAAEFAPAALVEALVAAGADPKAVDADGRTPAELAAPRRSGSVLAALGAPDPTLPLTWLWAQGVDRWVGRVADGTWSVFDLQRSRAERTALRGVALLHPACGLVIAAEGRERWGALTPELEWRDAARDATPEAARARLADEWTRAVKAALEAGDVAAALDPLGRLLHMRVDPLAPEATSFQEDRALLRALQRSPGGALALAMLIEELDLDAADGLRERFLASAGWEGYEPAATRRRIQQHEELCRRLAERDEAFLRQRGLARAFEALDARLPGESALDVARTKAAIGRAVLAGFGVETTAALVAANWPVAGGDDDYPVWRQRTCFLAGLDWARRVAVDEASGGRVDILGFDVALRAARAPRHWDKLAQELHGWCQLEPPRVLAYSCVAGPTAVWIGGRARFLDGSLRLLDEAEGLRSFATAVRTLAFAEGEPASWRQLEAIAAWLDGNAAHGGGSRAWSALVALARDAGNADQVHRWNLELAVSRERVPWARELLAACAQLDPADPLAPLVAAACREFLGQPAATDAREAAPAWLDAAFLDWADGLASRIAAVHSGIEAMLADEARARELEDERRRLAAQTEAFLRQLEAEQAEREAREQREAYAQYAAAHAAQWQAEANARAAIAEMRSPEHLRQLSNEMMAVGPTFLQYDSSGKLGWYRQKGWRD